MTPDEISYRYTVSYEQPRDPRLGGGLSQHAETVTFPAFDRAGHQIRGSDVHTALDAHHVAKRGDWVKPGMLRPHVSGLEVWQGGRQIGTRVEGADLAEVPHPSSVAAHA